jgi:small neutral amino acid transporter SnatA (MarC family)
MQTSFIFVLIVVGLFLIPIGALMVFLITYEEFSRHFTNKKKALKFAIEDAAIAFIILFFALLFGGYFISNFIINK